MLGYSVERPETAVQPIEITWDLTSVRRLLSELIAVMKSPGAPKSRERSLTITKLEEARMWANEAFHRE